jgi:hypothetical protein
MQGLFYECINAPGQVAIFVSYRIARVMGGKPYLHLIPNIAPKRVMIHFFSLYGYTGHKRESLRKIGKLKLAVQLVVFFFPHDAFF